ncbi:metalloregulator ArsR/SmtB family transcription factor [Streptomyces sp. TRM76323]|uniref:Metalloregulator ArsR/SmtB family transcription factor n=1 Tax=Streptomyces tamarix TaxID=3078565 RepID=A0ABU3QLU5_9ACTN|nr:metalloregulator ArsR/SmtB family transcription factor [Streptomyces tamarix]MDT9683733.1 metalloregulator ArsR/SmtB family transcription factor [Streptomyces tamarix]
MAIVTSSMSTPVIQLCCPPVLTGPLSQQDAEQLAAALRVIADPARLRLLGLIKSQPNGEACTCDLVEPLGLSQPTVSHHMKVLFEAGFLEREKRGRQTWYRLAPDSLSILRDALDPNAPQLA